MSKLPRADGTGGKTGAAGIGICLDGMEKPRHSRFPTVPSAALVEAPTTSLAAGLVAVGRDAI